MKYTNNTLSVGKKYFSALLIVLLFAFSSCNGGKKDDSNKKDAKTEVNSDDPDKIVDGIHVRTGFKDGEGVLVVANTCTVCHSSKLVIQNRMNKARWNETIKWMQETQGLWDLGENQKVIVDYLVKNYPITSKGRRERLRNIKWYDLK